MRVAPSVASLAAERPATHRVELRTPLITAPSGCSQGAPALIPAVSLQEHIARRLSMQSTMLLFNGGTMRLGSLAAAATTGCVIPLAHGTGVIIHISSIQRRLPLFEAILCANYQTF